MMRPRRDASLEHIPQRYVVLAKELRRAGLNVVRLQGVAKVEGASIIEDEEPMQAWHALNNGHVLILAHVIMISQIFRNPKGESFVVTMLDGTSVEVKNDKSVEPERTKLINAVNQFYHDR